MLFERENCKTIQNPSDKVIARELRRLKSYGRSSYASLTDPDSKGSFIQVAGGGVGCLLEKRDAQAGIHYRAWQEKPIVPFENGTELCFSGGRVALKANEWFNIGQVIEVFTTFLRNEKDPSFIRWRDITKSLQ